VSISCPPNKKSLGPASDIKMQTGVTKYGLVFSMVMATAHSTSTTPTPTPTPTATSTCVDDDSFGDQKYGDKCNTGPNKWKGHCSPGQISSDGSITTYGEYYNKAQVDDILSHCPIACQVERCRSVWDPPAPAPPPPIPLTSPYISEGAECYHNDQCLTGNCISTSAEEVPYANDQELGYSITIGSTCSNGHCDFDETGLVCNSNTTTCIMPAGTYCNEITAQHCVESVCTGGHCGLPAYHTCTSGSSCASGVCDSNRCTRVYDVEIHRAYDAPCTSPTQCNSGRCVFAKDRNGKYSKAGSCAASKTCGPVVRSSCHKIREVYHNNTCCSGQDKEMLSSLVKLSPATAPPEVFWPYLARYMAQKCSTKADCLSGELAVFANSSIAFGGGLSEGHPLGTSSVDCIYGTCHVTEGARCRYAQDCLQTVSGDKMDCYENRCTIDSSAGPFSAWV